MSSSPPILFISHSAEDKPLAEVLHQALEELLADTEASIAARYSSSAERGPQGGKDWRKWVEKQVVDARTALVLLTRSSIRRPWPLWEAGACRGVALSRAAAGATGDIPPHVISIRYGVTDEECPDPLVDEQIISGMDRSAIGALFRQILKRHVSREAGLHAAENMKSVVSRYLKRAKRILERAPSIVSEANVQEWLSRLDELTHANRWSELGDYKRRLMVAFGRDEDSKDLPIDVRIHRRLGEFSLQQEDYQDAIEQLQLARESAPRDLYVLSRLGEALIKAALERPPGSREQIEDVFERIEELAVDASSAYPDEAAQYGKYWRRVAKNPEKAIAVYRKALRASPESYYLAELLGQTQLETGDEAGARRTYRKTLQILGALPDQNIWTLATLATASLVSGRTERAASALRELIALNPSADERQSIRNGLCEVANRLSKPVDKLDDLLGTL